MTDGVSASGSMEPWQTFLWFAGWKDAVLEPITGDASPRRYFRVRKGLRTAILMDASLNLESVAPFVAIDEHLRKLGFRAPEILARDITQGWLLLEDFGDETFARALDRGDDPRELLGLATDLLAALHQRNDASPPWLRTYDPERMLGDLEMFLEWRAPDLPSAAHDEFRQAWRRILPLAHQVPASLLLRDFHVANLMRIPGATAQEQAGLLDFQDAYVGPVTYDLISLLEDARRDFPSGLREEMLGRYRARFPNPDSAAFEQSLAILAAQRHTRVLGIFERLSRRENRHEYKQLHSPRVERRLRDALRHPILAEVRNWMNRYVFQS